MNNSSAANDTARKIRVLLVEDEPDISMAIKIIMKSNFPCDEIAIASHGEEAWDILKDDNFNLIISDWNMPRMTGDRLLELVRSDGRTRNIPFLMLTVRKDHESVMTAIKGGVTDYILKPFGQNILISKVESLLGTQHTTQHALNSKVKTDGGSQVAKEAILTKLMRMIERGDFVLPALPQLIVKIEEAMINPGITTEEVAKLIEVDAGPAAKVIAVANSPYYRGNNECTSVNEALLRIGLQETRQLIFIISNKSIFTANDPRFAEIVEKLFLHSVATGAACQCIARNLRLGDPHEYFLMGLLHDIGKLIVLQALSDMTADANDISYASIEESMDSLHNKVGKLLLEKWRFPSIYGLIALKHQELSAYHKPGKELSVVHFCNMMVRELGYSFKESIDKDLLKNITSRHLLGLTKEITDATNAEIEEYIGKVMTIL